MKKIFRSPIGGFIAGKSIYNRLRLRIGKGSTSIIKKIFSTNGIILTFIIGMFINVGTNYIQDRIERQRYFELLQYEITGHVMLVNNIVKEYGENGFLSNSLPYNNEVYKAGLSNGYLLSLPSKQLVSIISYYETIIPLINSMDNDIRSSINKFFYTWTECIYSDLDSTEKDWTTCTNKQTDFKVAREAYSEKIYKSSLLVNDHANKILDNYNPTRDRLHSPILNTLMGNDSLPIMK